MKSAIVTLMAAGLAIHLNAASSAQSSSAIVCWGDNSLHQHATPTPPASQIRLAGSCSVLRTGFLSSQGVLELWGDGASYPPNAPASLSDIDQAGLGYSHGVALRRDGSIVAWGDNTYGQTDVPPNLLAIVKISAGGFFNTALHANGTVTCWGMGSANSGPTMNFGQCVVPQGISGVVLIASGDHHTLAYRVDGSLVGWGDNRFGQLDFPAEISGIIQLAAGGLHTVVLRSNGEVTCLGTTVAFGGLNYNFGQCNVPAGLTDVIQVAAGNWHSAALRRDGHVAVWGNNDAKQCDVPADLHDVVQIASGRYHVAALRAFQTIDSVTPISGPASGGTRVTIVGSNFNSNCEVRFDGQLATDVVINSSSSLQATTPPNFPGEATVSVNDSSRVAFYYRPECGSDLDQDGEVSGGDLAILLLDWGPCYSSMQAGQSQDPPELLAEEPAQKPVQR